MTHDDLEREFGKYGQHKEVRMAPRSPGFAFVEFENMSYVRRSVARDERCYRQWRAASGRASSTKVEVGVRCRSQRWRGRTLPTAILPWWRRRGRDRIVPSRLASKGEGFAVPQS
ncbi:hypothetical protein MRX96_014438 [Rhipicephalus microplus]